MKKKKKTFLRLDLVIRKYMHAQTIAAYIEKVWKTSVGALNVNFSRWKIVKNSNEETKGVAAKQL